MKPRNHSEACRERIEAKIAETTAGQDRIKQVKERFDIKTAAIGSELMEEKVGDDKAEGDGAGGAPASTSPQDFAEPMETTDEANADGPRGDAAGGPPAAGGGT